MPFLYNGEYYQPSTLSLPHPPRYSPTSNTFPLHAHTFYFYFVSHTQICKQCSSPSFAVKNTPIFISKLFSNLWEIIFFPRKRWVAQGERVRLPPPQRNVTFILNWRLFFSLTMTSEIESSRSYWETPLEQKHFLRAETSQWRLLTCLV